jgi:hypothetical protein
MLIACAEHRRFCRSSHLKILSVLRKSIVYAPVAAIASKIVHRTWDEIECRLDVCKRCSRRDVLADIRRPRLSPDTSAWRSVPRSHWILKLDSLFTVTLYFSVK